MLALVFFGNETMPPSVGLDVRFWFQAMTFMLDLFARIQLPTDIPSHRVHYRE